MFSGEFFCGQVFRGASFGALFRGVFNWDAIDWSFWGNKLFRGASLGDSSLVKGSTKGSHSSDLVVHTVTKVISPKKAIIQHAFFGIREQ